MAESVFSFDVESLHIGGEFCPAGREMEIRCWLVRWDCVIVEWHEFIQAKITSFRHDLG